MPADSGRSVGCMGTIGNQTIVVGIGGSADSDAALDWAVADVDRAVGGLVDLSARADTSS